MKKSYFILILIILLMGCVAYIPEAQASDSAVLVKQALVVQTIRTTKTISKTDLVKQKSVIDKSALVQQKMKFSKKVGMLVNQNDIIGYEGGMPGTCGAGLSTGPHLHFEMRQKGAILNPNDYFSRGFIWPIPKHRITQEFGEENQTPWYKTHTGIDMTLNYGAQVRASKSGRIIFNGIYNGYGHLIIIDHGLGLWSYYGHLICS